MKNSVTKVIKDNIDLINSNQFDELYKKLSVWDKGKLSDVFITAGIDFLSFMKKIPNECFYYSTEVTALMIPGNIKRIGNCAFVNSSLTSVSIPNSVTSIGNYAFSSCRNLERILFNGTKEMWNSIVKGTDWNPNTRDYKIQCIDGEFNND